MHKNTEHLSTKLPEGGGGLTVKNCHTGKQLYSEHSQTLNNQLVKNNMTSRPTKEEKCYLQCGTNLMHGSKMTTKCNSSKEKQIVLSVLSVLTGLVLTGIARPVCPDCPDWTGPDWTCHAGTWKALPLQSNCTVCQSRLSSRLP